MQKDPIYFYLLKLDYIASVLIGVGLGLFDNSRSVLTVIAAKSLMGFLEAPIWLE